MVVKLREHRHTAAVQQIVHFSLAQRCAVWAVSCVCDMRALFCAFLQPRGSGIKLDGTVPEVGAALYTRV